MDVNALIERILNGLLDGELDRDELFECIENLEGWLRMGGFDPDHEDYVDLVSALYWGLANCHSGQFTDSYRALSQISSLYTPGMMDTGPVEDSHEAELFERVKEVLLA